MQKLTVKYLSGLADLTDINEISSKLNIIEKQTLEFIPWKEYPYKPSVKFSISYTTSSILLKFFVEEKQIRAINQTINSSIWEDSCVEFFINFDDSDCYYNIEFNCIGTGLIGYGKSKTDRALLEDGLVKQVKTLSNICEEKGKKVSWELTMIIPLTIFTHTEISNLSNIKCRANFYKCGDLLPEPHFISWADVKSEKPNFHLPEYFGLLNFESIQ